MIELGTLEPIDPRSVWTHEAHDFTPWLLANSERLAEALGVELQIDAAEQPVGMFSLDLIGVDLTHDRPLIVENQLEQTDHSHLGQLLTYAGGTAEAATIVWIATRFRPEHRSALDWLNSTTVSGTDFFGVELKVVRIGDSLPAPLFEIVAEPNGWNDSVKRATAAASSGNSKGPLYVSFWETFLQRVKAEHPDWSRARSAPTDSYFEMSMGLPAGCMLVSCFGVGGTLRQELYIGRSTAEESKAVFDRLHADREAIDERFGAPLDWLRLDDKKASKVAWYGEGTIEDSDAHEAYIDWFLSHTERLRHAIEPYIHGAAS